MKRLSPRLLSWPLFIALLLPVFANADELLDEATRLIKAEQPLLAYELLIEQAVENAGQPEFDLLLGIAALDAGEPTQAVFALERVLTVQPDNARARTELVRAYYEMGENEAAREEFTRVKRQNLPAAVEESISKYLLAIDARLTAQRRRIDVHIEAVSGYDANINSATDAAAVAIPLFNNAEFTLDQNSRERGSAFAGLNVGAAFSSLAFDRDDVRVFGSLGYNERITFEETDFRTRIINGSFGLRYNRGKQAWLGSLLAQRYYLGGLNLQWLHAWDQRTQLSLFAQTALHRFPGQRIRNINQYSGGLGLVHALQQPGRPVVYASVFGGTDEPRNGRREDIGRRFIGARLGGQYSLTGKVLLTAGASYQYSRYGAADPLFRERRDDRFLFLRAGLSWSIDENWTIKPELRYSHNDSSNPINNFTRWQTFITVRNQF